MLWHAICDSSRTPAEMHGYLLPSILAIPQAAMSFHGNKMMRHAEAPRNWHDINHHAMLDPVADAACESRPAHDGHGGTHHCRVIAERSAWECITTLLTVSLLLKQSHNGLQGGQWLLALLLDSLVSSKWMLTPAGVIDLSQAGA